jgi:hypothetical protein
MKCTESPKIIQSKYNLTSSIRHSPMSLLISITFNSTIRKLNSTTQKRTTTHSPIPAPTNDVKYTSTNTGATIAHPFTMSPQYRCSEMLTGCDPQRRRAEARRQDVPCPAAAAKRIASDSRFQHPMHAIPIAYNFEEPSKFQQREMPYIRGQPMRLGYPAELCKTHAKPQRKQHVLCLTICSS